MKVTTKVTRTVARKLISNFVKGNPHFKPWLGEHGKCSWFLVSGDPYAGVDPSKNILLKATIDDAYTKKDHNLVENELKRAQDDPTLTGYEKREFHLEVWNRIGKVCEVRGFATVLYVPQCELSMQGSGYFLVLPSSMRQHLHVDFSCLEDQNINYQEILASEQEREDRKNENIAPTLTIWVGPCRTKTDCEKLLTGVEHSFGDVIRIQAEEVGKVKLKIGWGETREENVVYLVVTLKYRNYRESRTALRNILVDIHPKRGIVCVAGNDWDEKTRQVNTMFGVLSAADKKPTYTSVTALS
jgi:hypothetical protein